MYVCIHVYFCIYICVPLCVCVCVCVCVPEYVWLCMCIKKRLKKKKVKVKAAQLCLTLCDPMDYTGPWNSPGQNTGMVSLSLLQGIFPTQGSNPGPLHCRRILYQLRHQGSPVGKPCAGFTEKSVELSDLESRLEGQVASFQHGFCLFNSVT